MIPNTILVYLAANDSLQPGHPDSWWDTIGILFVTIPAIIAAVAALHNRHDLKTVKDQVQNGHAINFRDEVTNMATAVNRLTELLHMLHSDVREERTERRQAIKELREDLNDRFETIREVRSFNARTRSTDK